VESGKLESGFTQSDVAYWAYTATGIFKGKPPAKNIRAIANLYPESVHVVARKGSGIKSVYDLRGKRVSLDEPGSGTLVDARIILEAFGLDEHTAIKARYLKGTPAVEKLLAGEIDAFFAVAGYPEAAVARAISKGGATLVPLAGPVVDGLLKNYRFFSRDLIPANAYEGVGDTPTISVNAIWIVSVETDEDLVYQIVKALWNEQSRRLLDNGHAKGKLITLETAVNGIGIPLHAGAERYYREVGRLK
jgi:hypothetical protein